MKSNLSNTRSHMSTSASKSRKNNKEREKRKSQSDKQENNDKESPAKVTKSNDYGCLFLESSYIVHFLNGYIIMYHDKHKL